MKQTQSKKNAETTAAMLTTQKTKRFWAGIGNSRPESSPADPVSPAQCCRLNIFKSTYFRQYCVPQLIQAYLLMRGS